MTSNLKREQDDSDLADIEPPSKKTKELVVYVVTRTDYTDDYKDRGRGWSSGSIPVLFRTRAAACKYIVDDQMDYVRDYVKDNLWGEPNAAKYFLDKTFTDPTKDELDEEAVLADRANLLKRATKGAFVEESVTWAAHDVVVKD